MNTKKSISRAGLMIGLGLLLLAGALVWDALALRVMPYGNDIGPRTFPLLIAGGLILCGTAVLKSCLDGVYGLPVNTDDGPTDWRALGLIALALLGMAVFLPWLGFIVCATGLFATTAFAFGSRKIIQILLVGLILAVSTWYVFTHGLGLQLPAGQVFKFISGTV